MKVMNTVKILLMIALYGSALPMYGSAKDQKSAAQVKTAPAAARSAATATAATHSRGQNRGVFRDFDGKLYENVSFNQVLSAFFQPTQPSANAIRAMPAATAQIEKAFAAVASAIPNDPSRENNVFNLNKIPEVKKLSPEQRKALMQKTNVHGLTLLRIGVGYYYHPVEVIRQLVAAGSDTNFICNGVSILGTAVQNCSYEVIKTLVEHPAMQINHVDSRGNTALTYAAKDFCSHNAPADHRLKVILLLLANGANMFIGHTSVFQLALRNYQRTYYSQNPEKSIEKKLMDQRILELLQKQEKLQLDAKLAAIDNNASKTTNEHFQDLMFLLSFAPERACAKLQQLKKALSSQEFIKVLSQRDPIGHSLLSYAVSLGSLEFVQALLAERANVNFDFDCVYFENTQSAITVLELAVNLDSAEKALEMAKLLLPYCNPNISFNLLQSHGKYETMSALYAAIGRNDLALFKLILEDSRYSTAPGLALHYATINAQNFQNDSLALQKNSEIIKLLTAYKTRYEKKFPITTLQTAPAKKSVRKKSNVAAKLAADARSKHEKEEREEKEKLRKEEKARDQQRLAEKEARLEKARKDAKAADAAARASRDAKDAEDAKKAQDALALKQAEEKAAAIAAATKETLIASSGSKPVIVDDADAIAQKFLAKDLTSGNAGKPKELASKKKTKTQSKNKQRRDKQKSAAAEKASKSQPYLDPSFLPRVSKHASLDKRAEEEASAKITQQVSSEVEVEDQQNSAAAFILNEVAAIPKPASQKTSTAESAVDNKKVNN